MVGLLFLGWSPLVLLRTVVLLALRLFVARSLVGFLSPVVLWLFVLRFFTRFLLAALFGFLFFGLREQALEPRRNHQRNRTFGGLNVWLCLLYTSPSPTRPY